MISGVETKPQECKGSQMMRFLISCIVLSFLLTSCNSLSNRHVIFVIVKQNSQDDHQSILLIDNKGDVYTAKSTLHLKNRGLVKRDALIESFDSIAQKEKSIEAEVVAASINDIQLLSTNDFSTGISDCDTHETVSYFALEFDVATQQYQTKLLHHQGDYTRSNLSAISDTLMAWLKPLAINTGMETQIGWCLGGSQF